MPKVSSITRVLQIIEAVSYAPKPISPLELSQELDIPKPTIHRLIQQLVDEGFVMVEMAGGVIPGKRVRNLSVELWQQRQFYNERQVVLRSLVDDVKETCGIAVPQNMYMVHTNRVKTDSALQIFQPTGSKTPSWCTSTGKLYLSQMPIERRDKLLENLNFKSYTSNTITNLKKLNKELDKIAKTRIGIDNEEYIPDMVSVSVPILDKQQRYLASLYVHAPTIRVSLNRLIDFAPRMQEAAEDIQELVYTLQN